MVKSMHRSDPRRVVRLRRYPYLADYLGVKEEFRPFVGFVHGTGYRSPAVNIDPLGLREQYDIDGDFLDLTEPSSLGPECNVLLGGSVVFGVGASNDRLTLASHLNDTARPCLNLGLCGGSSQQELAIYLVLRSGLPPVRNVVLLSGANECLLAALDRAVIFPRYGGSFSAKAELPRLDGGTSAAHPDHTAKRWLADLTAKAYEGSRVVRLLARRASRRDFKGLRPNPTDPPFHERLAVTLAKAVDNLQIWAALQASGEERIHYILQPVAPWVSRPLTPQEQELIAAERASMPGTASLADPKVHAHVRSVIAEACAQHGVAFHDSNQWLGHDIAVAEEIFIDHCHLTDAGNALIARRMREELDWR